MGPADTNSHAITPARQQCGRAWMVGTAFVVGMGLYTAVPTPLAAQAAPAVADSSVGTVVGVVRDASGRPIADAVVYLTGQRRDVRTRADGAFRLPVPARGRYTVGARRLGYRGVSEEVRLDTGVTRIDLEMERLPDYLSSVITTANRGGLSGVVLDTDGNPVPNATVQPIGGGVGSTRTNAQGEFFLGVKGGKYLLRLDKPGLRRQIVGVTVPKDTGRRMVATMAIQIGKPNPQEGANLFDMQQRVIRASPVWQRLVTREDMIKFGSKDAQQVARRFSASPVRDDECALLDGGPGRAPLWAIDVEEIEFMETTAKPAPLRPPPGAEFACRHVVWLRR